MSRIQFYLKWCQHQEFALNISRDFILEKDSFHISSIERDAQYNRINIDKISKAIWIQSSGRLKKQAQG